MAEDSFHPIWTPSTAKLEELIKKLRRRDNLEDFVDGLIETEIYPYPSGQKTIVPATYIPVQDVCIKTGAAAILTTIEIRGIPPPIGSDTKFVYSDVTMTLTPQDGVGTYEMEYQWPSKLREDAPTPPTRQDFERIRMAMWARYEWVLERIDWINRLRNEAHVIVDEGQFKLADHINADLDSNCSEASDWDQVDGESICSHDSNDSIDDGSDPNDPIKFPDADALGALDLKLLQNLFEQKELASLHSAIKNQQDSFKQPHNSLGDEVTTFVVESTSKRQQDEEEQKQRKKARLDLAESVQESFLEVAKVLSVVDSQGEQVRFLRAAAGSLHLAARLLELDVNLSPTNLTLVPTLKPRERMQTGTTSATLSDAPTDDEGRSSDLEIVEKPASLKDEGNSSEVQIV